MGFVVDKLVISKGLYFFSQHHKTNDLLQSSAWHVNASGFINSYFVVVAVFWPVIYNVVSCRVFVNSYFK